MKLREPAKPQPKTISSSSGDLKLRELSEVGRDRLETTYKAVLKDNDEYRKKVSDLKDEKEFLEAYLKSAHCGELAQDEPKVKELQEQLDTQKQKMWLLGDQARQCPNKGYHGFRVQLPPKVGHQNKKA